jgi:hypothetical protein
LALDSAFSISPALTDISLLRSAGGDGRAYPPSILAAGSCRPAVHQKITAHTNENTNGLLRDWFPKGESLDDVSDSEVQEACDSLNRRPRKRLNWNCPWEVYHHQSLHLL